jgi:uncharacterized protein with LGFP repeats
MDAEEQAKSTTVTTPTGEVVIRGRVYAKWRALQAVKTPDGDDAQAHLGPPRGAEVPLPGTPAAGAVQFFERGMIVARPDGRAFAVYGAIFDHYVAIGGISSAIGLPTSDEEEAPRGARVGRFQAGDVYWRADAGARTVVGDARRRCEQGGDPFARSWVRRAGTWLKSLGRRSAAGARG